jgi:peptidyl-prolyl cis-trans isomerase D
MFGKGGLSRGLMGVIVVAIIAVFILEFRSAGSRPSGSIRRECAIRIDGQCLTLKDYYAAYGLIVPRQVSQKQVKALSLRRHVLDGLIERELLVGEAERLGLAVDEEAAKRELRLGRAHASLPAQHALRLGRMLDLSDFDEHGVVRDMVRELPILDAKTQEVDDDLYGRVVRSTTNRSPKEFLKMQQREVLASRMRDIVRARVRVSEEEAFDAFERAKSNAVVRYVRIDPDWFARWSVEPTDQLADKYAEEHKAEIDEAWKTASSKWKAECPIVSEIVQSVSAEATEAEKTEKQQKIQQAKALLDKGKAFDVVARELSDGPAAAAGGHLGCLTAEGYGEGGDALAKATEGLAPGANTGVVETKRGYHLLRVESRLAAADVEKVGRRSIARPLAVRAASTARAKEFGAKLIAAAKAGARLDDTVRSLLPSFVSAAPAAKKPAKAKAGEDAEGEGALADPRAPKAEVSAPFGVDGDPVPGAYGAELGHLAFALEKPDDVHPEPISTFAGMVVLQLKEKTVATRDEFKTAKTEFIRGLEIEKRSDALSRFVGRLRQNKLAKIEISDKILEEPKAAAADGD